MNTCDANGKIHTMALAYRGASRGHWNTPARATRTAHARADASRRLSYRTGSRATGWLSPLSLSLLSLPEYTRAGSASKVICDTPTLRPSRGSDASALAPPRRPRRPPTSPGSPLRQGAARSCPRPRCSPARPPPRQRGARQPRRRRRRRRQPPQRRTAPWLATSRLLAAGGREETLFTP